MFKHTVLFTAVISASTIVAAADSAIKNTIIEQELVTATRHSSPALPVATSINVIDAEQIRLSGAQKVSQVLSSAAGIQLQDADGSGGRNVTVSMRGFGGNAGNNTLILVDGRKLNNPTLASPSLNAVSLKDVARIEVMQGSAGVLYGDQAVGGVINIVTREPEKGDVDAHIEVTAGADDLRRVTGSLSHKLNSGVYYRVSAEDQSADNFRDNNEQEYNNVLAKLGWDFSGGDVFAEYQRIDDDLRLPGAVSDEQAADNPRQTNTPNNYSDHDTEMVRVGGDIALTNEWQLLAEYSDREDKGVSSFSGSVLQQQTDVKSFTPRVVGELNTQSGTAVVTAGYDRIRSDYSRQSAFGGVDMAQELDAYYAQMVWPLNQAFTTTAGLRYANVDDRNQVAATRHDDNLKAYELGVSWQLTDNSRLFARTADAFRFANVDENGYTLPEVDFLKPQESDSIEVGAEWSNDSVNATVTVFDMSVNNELMYDSSANFGFGANINLPESDRQGVNTRIEYQLAQDWQLLANASYIDAELSSGTFKGNDVPYVASELANLTVVYSATPDVTVYVDVGYTGDRYRAGDDANAEGKVGSVTVVNANVNWQYQSVELGLRVNNLTDRDYANYHSASPWSGNTQYPQPGRNVAFTAAYHF